MVAKRGTLVLMPANTIQLAGIEIENNSLEAGSGSGSVIAANKSIAKIDPVPSDTTSLNFSTQITANGHTDYSTGTTELWIDSIREFEYTESGNGIITTTNTVFSGSIVRLLYYPSSS